jgi:hypothetical protein
MAAPAVAGQVLPFQKLSHTERYQRMMQPRAGLAEKDWLMMQTVEIKPGDVLIKHVFHPHGVTEGAIRLSAKMHSEKNRGSLTAEHAALVGAVNGVTRIFEAVGQGIVAQGSGDWTSCQFQRASNEPGHEDGMQGLFKNNAYVVYRLTTENSRDKRVLQLLWDGMATRLATIQGESPGPTERIPQNDFDVTIEGQTIDTLREIALMAHIPRGTKLGVIESNRFVGKASIIKGQTDGRQQTGYSAPVMVGHVTPNLIPDNLVGSSNDQKYISFIKGERYGIKDICSGFVATMLQTWSVWCGYGRPFTDPTQLHPTGLQRHFQSSICKRQGWRCVGTWGRAEAQMPH